MSSVIGIIKLLEHIYI